MVKHDAKIVLAPPETLLKKIETEINNLNWLPALFLEASTIEAYLTSLIFLSSPKGINAEFSKSVTDYINKMHFIAIININSILGHIDDTLYKQLTSFNAKRNDYVHYLIGINFSDTETDTELKNLVKKGLILCRTVAEIHSNKLKRLKN